MNTHKLVIDSRENSELFGFVEFEAHRLMITTEKKWLEIGDYVYADMCFEAKSSVDFIQSVINKRLWNQIDNMDRHFEHCYVIIHGSLHEAMNYPKFANFNMPAHLLKSKFYGAMGKIMLDTDCNVLWLENPKKAAELMVALCKMRHITRKVINPSLLKRITTDDLRTDLLCTINGVSESKAKKLVKEFGSIMEIGESTIEELSRIEGIGPTIAERIINVLNTEERVII